MVILFIAGKFFINLFSNVLKNFAGAVNFLKSFHLRRDVNFEDNWMFFGVN